MALTTTELHDLADEVDPECRQNPLLFFSRSRMEREAAEIVCGRCLMQPECLDYAMDRGVDSGVWGGVDFDLLAKTRKRAPRTRNGEPSQTPARQGKVNHDG